MVTLGTTTLGDPDRVRGYVFFLHGILGSRSNWRSIARRAVADWPGVGAVLVDLRHHGESLDFDPPHTLDTAAGDLVSLARELPHPLVGALGHSFGGKVALALAASPDRPTSLRHLWVIDSCPGARPERTGSEATLEVLKLLKGLPTHWAERDDFIDAVVDGGHAPAVAAWLAMNLTRAEAGGWRWPIDLGAIESLLADYFAKDLWPVLEDPELEVDLVAGGTSAVLAPADLERAAKASSTRLHVVEGAGHWVHVDAPEEVSRVLRETAP